MQEVCLDVDMSQAETLHALDIITLYFSSSSRIYSDQLFNPLGLYLKYFRKASGKAFNHERTVVHVVHGSLFCVSRTSLRSVLGFNMFGCIYSIHIPLSNAISYQQLYAHSVLSVQFICQKNRWMTKREAQKFCKTNKGLFKLYWLWCLSMCVSGEERCFWWLVFSHSHTNTNTHTNTHPHTHAFISDNVQDVNMNLHVLLLPITGALMKRTCKTTSVSANSSSSLVL